MRRVLIVIAIAGCGLLAPQAALSTTATQVSAGGNHTCAVTVEGSVMCWGGNRYGELGNGTRSRRMTYIPVAVVGLGSDVTQIAAGRFHTCALTASGGVKCWGRNKMGQLGDGTGRPKQIPVDVIGLTTGAVQIAAGGYHTCALMTGGAVKCWGGNYGGALGNGTTTNRPVPVDVAGLPSGVTQISTGWYHTCALANGGVKCWGANYYGQLGDGTTTNRVAPTDVSGLTSGVAYVATGGDHTCAVTALGAAKCWGANWAGLLGDGTTDWRDAPVDVVGLESGVAEIAASEFHTCARTVLGAAKCWGANDSGQLGDGTATNRASPVGVKGLAGGVAQISAAQAHACALRQTGEIMCWGPAYLIGHNSDWSSRRVASFVQGFGGRPTTTTLFPRQPRVKLHQPITFTVRINPVPDGGRVYFGLGNSGMDGCRSVPVVHGTASCTIRLSTHRHYTIRAEYLGTSRYKASQAESRTLIVDYLHAGKPAAGG